ncbi:MAG: heavy-metal-associated domain-containing protein [Ruminococcaceae bacterium]|nr:heavy-metal-associated domain-containing protein [Oscillospiraceae bacterium]
MFDKTENTLLTVNGMHCNHCKAKVENTLKALKGVKKYTVSLETASAEVEYVPKKITPAEIASAITNAGFEASVK